MNSVQKQVVLGTLLGNGHLNKGSLAIVHSLEDLPWLKTKGRLLEDYTFNLDIGEKNCVWRSIQDLFFIKLRTVCYKDNKKSITMDWLNQLTDVGLSVFFGDKGEVINNHAIIHSNNPILETYFNEVGMPCKLENNITFTIEGTKKLINMVCQVLPPNRYHKLK